MVQTKSGGRKATRVALVAVVRVVGIAGRSIRYRENPRARPDAGETCLHAATSVLLRHVSSLVVRARRSMSCDEGRRQKRDRRNFNTGHVPHGPAGSALGSHEVVPSRKRDPCGRFRGDANRREPRVRARTASDARRVRGALGSNVCRTKKKIPTVKRYLEGKRDRRL